MCREDVQHTTFVNHLDSQRWPRYRSYIKGMSEQWAILQALKCGLWYDPAIPLLGIHTEDTRIERDRCTPMFFTALFTIARAWKQPRCLSADEQVRKLCTYTQRNITQLLKGCIWISSNEVDETGAYYTEWGKSEKHQYSILMHIHGI